MKPYTLEQQMARFGIPESERGPFVTELRARTARKLAEGMVMQSAGSCTDAFWALSYEEQAKARLAWDWELDNLHSYRVEAIDGVMWRSYDASIGKFSTRILWRNIFPWIGDQWRKMLCDVRIFWHRKILGNVNPYV